MGSVNKVILVGNLGRDAELRYTPSGQAVANFTVATTDVWNDKSGQKQERTEWHRIDLWGKQAESVAEYLVKGKQVYVEGKLQTDEYADKDGNKKKSTKVRAERVVLLGGARMERPAHVRDEDIGHGEPSHASDPLLDDEPIA
jgi:single-strand DNA-binding protein